MTIEVISKKLKNNYYNFESKISIYFESCYDSITRTYSNQALITNEVELRYLLTVTSCNNGFVRQQQIVYYNERIHY